MLKNQKEKIKSAIAHKGFRRYLANTTWILAEQLLRIIAGLLVGAWVARYLGPNQFGIFNYALAFSSIFGVIAKLGIDGILVRDLLLHPEQRDAYLGSAFWLKLVAGILTLGAVTISMLLTENDYTTNLYIFIIASGMIFQSFEIIDFYFQSKALSKFVSICKIIQLTLSSLLKLYFVFTGAGLLSFVLISLFDQLTLATTLYFAYRLQGIGSFYKSFNLKIAKKLLCDSWPLIFGSLVLIIQARIDQLLLKKMIGNVEVGYYSSAMRLIEAAAFIPTVLNSSLYPAIANAKKSSETLYLNRIYSYYRLMMISFLLVGIPVYFFSNQIIVLLYGEAYSPAGYLMSIMALRLFFANYGVARSAFIMTENLMKYSMITMIIGTLVNIGLCYLWIPGHKSIGAIWAMMISFMVTIFIIDLVYRKTRRNAILMLKSILLLNVKYREN